MRRPAQRDRCTITRISRDEISLRFSVAASLQGAILLVARLPGPPSPPLLSSRSGVPLGRHLSPRPQPPALASIRMPTPVISNAAARFFLPHSLLRMRRPAHWSLLTILFLPRHSIS